MNLKVLKLIAYVIGTRFSVELVGKLLYSDVIAIALLPTVNFMKLNANFQYLKKIVGALLLVLSSQIFSDYINDAEVSDFLRGWALYIITIVLIVFLTDNLYRNKNGAEYYLLTLAIVNLIFGETVDLAQQIDNTNYFKQRIMGFLTPAIILTCYYLTKIGSKKLVPLVLLFSSLVYFLADARSAGLALFVASLVLYSRSIKIRLSKAKVIIFSAILLVISSLSYVAYVDQVLDNNIGGSNTKFQFAKMDNPYNPFELLYFGRTDFFVLIEAITDKPITGHGSWGKDLDGRYSSAALLKEKSSSRDNIGYISAHSILLGVWAYAGIVGFFAITYIFLILFKLVAFLFKYGNNSDYFPVVILLSVSMLWDFFFSPINSLRTLFPFFVALILVESFNVKNELFLLNSRQ